ALSRVKKDEQGHPSIAPLYRTALPVTLNQTLVVGASKVEGSKNALILIILAQETARPGTPGGKSVRKSRAARSGSRSAGPTAPSRRRRSRRPTPPPPAGTSSGGAATFSKCG